MNLVVDTNVIVSGLLNPFGAPGKIVELIASGDLSLFFDARILLEYKAVLSRAKFSIHPDEVADLLEQIETRGSLISAKPLSIRLQDKGDEAFLEVAVGAKSPFLITGNLKHFPHKHYEDVKIIPPASFIEIYRKS